MVCGKAVDEIKKEKINWYMEKSTPRGEPEVITKLRREAYINGLNAGSLLFIAPAVSQAAACDGNNYDGVRAGRNTGNATNLLRYKLRTLKTCPSSSLVPIFAHPCNDCIFRLNRY